jgi:hypothetical protein
MHVARNFLQAKTFRRRPLRCPFTVAPQPLPRRTHREMETSPDEEKTRMHTQNVKTAASESTGRWGNGSVWLFTERG